MILTMRKRRAKAQMDGFLMAALAAYILGDMEQVKSMMNHAAIWYQRYSDLFI